MLTQRQQTILHLIIQNYTDTGQPTGSKRLMEDGVEASSATIRNEMKALEEAGLLLKTHSSSGRVPSMAGYRYYVDHLLRPSKVNQMRSKQFAIPWEKNFMKSMKSFSNLLRSYPILRAIPHYR